MLKIRLSDDNAQAIWVLEKNFSIGSGQTNQLTIIGDDVEDVHARIIHHNDGYQLKDLSNIQGTYINGARISKRLLHCGDKIQIGENTIEVIDPYNDGDSKQWSLIADASWLCGQEFPLYEKNHGAPMLLGRANDCDITIPGTHLSRHHAEITVTQNGLQVHDLGSSNGTYVNDQRVTTAVLNAGDRLRLDVYSFRVFGPGLNFPKASTVSQHTNGKAAHHSSATDIEKKWIVPPTSPGNRFENDHYNKNWTPLVLSVLLVLAFVGGLLHWFLT